MFSFMRSSNAPKQTDRVNIRCLKLKTKYLFFQLLLTLFLRRSTSESNEIAKLYMTSMRMKKALQSLPSQRRTKMSSFRTSLDSTIEKYCENLTKERRVCHQTCDSNSRFRTISGCCNNLKNSDFGKKICSII